MALLNEEASSANSLKQTLFPQANHKCQFVTVIEPN